MNEQAWLELDQRYRRIFGEGIPRAMLPADEVKAIALIGEAIATRDDSVFLRNLPPDALA